MVIMPEENRTTAPANRSKERKEELKFGMDRILAKDDNNNNRTNADLRYPVPCAAMAGSCKVPMFLPDPPFCCFSANWMNSEYQLPLYIAACNLYNSGTSSLNSQDESMYNSPPAGRRKRSWSRAVFSNLQRKGLEKRFMIQKYITKPDRRQLAATLGLTDAQVKVWFQNRRMKWRHSRDGRQDMEEGTTMESFSKTSQSP